VEAFRLRGGAPLTGRVAVSGAKNACLPIMAASLLAAGESRLRGAPDLTDVRTLSLVLAHIGVRATRSHEGLKLDASALAHSEATYDLVRQMRASILVLGPLLARCHAAKVSLPGGCAIGARPIDQHLKGMAALGATIELKHGYVHATAPGGLRGADFRFEVPTVTGTENVLLAAVLAQGESRLANCATEPEVTDLVDVLASMGARIRGRGTATLTVEGVPSLAPYDHQLIPDRIEFGTLLVAGALMGKGLTIDGGVVAHHGPLIDALRQSGVVLDIDAAGPVHVERARSLRAQALATAPYPGFATDMQAQMMLLLTQANGESTLRETIWENRFMHVAELNRLGADIRAKGGEAKIFGPTPLSGTRVMATDLRASACLVLAGLIAEGETVVRRIYHLDRGYERLERKLRAAGAHIERFTESAESVTDSA
jgi:UDP-N-acetylglucosamine 1-carboxyvinyltransferase